FECRASFRKQRGAARRRPLVFELGSRGYGVTVSGWSTCVVPATVSAVSDAREWYDPRACDVMSNGIDTEPPAAGGMVWSSHSEPSAGAEARFAPLDPVRFSAPQFTPESGSPEPAFPRPGPSPGEVWFGPYE